MKHLATISLLLVSLFASSLSSGDALDGCKKIELTDDLVIGYKYSPPFVMVANGDPVGISIKLWEEVADCLGIPEKKTSNENVYGYRWQWAKNIDELLNTVSDCEVDDTSLPNTKACGADIALAAISINADREQQYDFSHRYYEGSLGVLVPDQQGSQKYLLLLKRIFSSELLIIILGLFAFMLIVAFGYWYGERKKNNEFFREGFFKVIIWSILLVFQGKGDPYSLKTRFGQLFFLFLMFFGVTIVSSFTAIITSSLTLQGLEEEITELSDLKNKKIGVISNSGTLEVIDSEKYGLSPVFIENLKLVQGQFDNRNIHAFIHDRDILSYLVSKQLLMDVKLAPLSINPQDYGIAFPNGSNLIQPINEAILRVLESSEWRANLYENLEKDADI